MGEWGKRATVATKRLSDGKIIPEMEEEQSSSSDAKNRSKRQDSLTHEMINVNKGIAGV